MRLRDRLKAAMLRRRRLPMRGRLRRLMVDLRPKAKRK
jgi:hypothetical protein